MASPFIEKLQVAVITATVVSAGWIMAGAIFLDREESAAEERAEAEVEAAQLAAVPPGDDTASPSLSDTAQASAPSQSDTAVLLIPVLGITAEELVNNFSDERSGTALHEAIDIAADEGTSVIAAAPGTVEQMFLSDVGGNTVYVRSADGETIYYYAHLAEYAPGLSEGQQVRRGQRLGTVGSTGRAEPEAPHLHFEVMRTTADAEWWEPATSVNPYPLLTGS